MARARGFTKEEAEAVAARLRSGETLSAISREYGINRKAMRGRLATWGITVRLPYGRPRTIPYGPRPAPLRGRDVPVTVEQAEYLKCFERALHAPVRSERMNGVLDRLAARIVPEQVPGPVEAVGQRVKRERLDLRKLPKSGGGSF